LHGRNLQEKSGGKKKRLLKELSGGESIRKRRYKRDKKKKVFEKNALRGGAKAFRLRKEADTTQNAEKC